MGNFFKTVFGSCLGVFLFFALGFLLIIIFAVGASSGSKSKGISKNTVLTLSLDGMVPEKTNNTDRDPFSFEEDVPGVYELSKAIRHASTDSKISGILLQPDILSITGKASAYVLRKELENFKKSGKWIYAYGDAYGMENYYLASVANKIYMYPEGMIDFRGYGRTYTYFKDMLDKIGVKAQVYYAGKFKSATEPFRSNGMSPENRLQVREYMVDQYNLYLEEVSASRNIPISSLKQYADSMSIKWPQDAVDKKLIDGLKYKDEVIAEMKTKLGIKGKEKIKTISIQEYCSTIIEKSNGAKDKIALVYAEGEIGDGEQEPGTITGNYYSRLLRKIREDDKVKAVVLRVNSPGGSGLASDKIWREITLLRKEGKPVIVSFGDVAASGGYYIACAADSIFAEKNTITGSIGVFALIPTFEGLMKDKLGLHFDTVNTARHATDFGVNEAFSDSEGKYIQGYIDNFYDTFIQKVADGRKKSKAEINEIAQGRVWTGSRGVEIGLVDRIGSIDDAIVSAAKKSKLSKYQVVEYPATQDPMENFIEKITGKKKDEDGRAKVKTKSIVQQELETLVPEAKYLFQIKEWDRKIMCRMPFFIEN
jgi:protease IV